MAAILQIKPITDVPADRSQSANPRDPAFYQNPYAFYDRLHAGHNAFFWEEYGHWCFAGFKEVSALLRDKRFGREILHVATREESACPSPSRTPPISTSPRSTRCSISSRRATPVCAPWSIVPSSPATSSSCGRASSASPTR